MGDVADMMLDGTLCASCGEYLGTDAGYPIYCDDCAPDFEPAGSATKPRTNCPDCGKRVKVAGLADHRRDAHGVQP